MANFLASGGLGDLGQYMAATLSPDAEKRSSAVSAVDQLSKQAGFCTAILALILNSEVDPGSRLACSTYLKNFIRSHWKYNSSLSGTFLVEDERAAIRTGLLDALLTPNTLEKSSRSLLGECVRLVAIEDFPERWVDIEGRLSTTLNTTAKENPQVLSNVIFVIYVVCKRYEFFLKPFHKATDVPAELESLATSVLPTLVNEIFVPEATSSRQRGSCVQDDMLRMIAKIFFRMTRSYLPKGAEKLVPSILSSSLNVLQELLNTAANQADTADEEELNTKWRLHKRLLKQMESFQKNKRKLLEPQMAELFTLCRKAAQVPRAILADRIYAICLDILAESTAVDAHFKLIKAEYADIVENSVFPHLELSLADKERWSEDEDEYVRSNLALESMDMENDVVESFTARKSAMNFLTATSNYAESETKSGGGGGGKKKGKKHRGGGSKPSTPTFQIVLNYIDKLNHKMASDIADIAKKPAAEAVDERKKMEVVREKKQFSILLAYGAMADAVSKATKGAAISTFLRNNVLPACDKAGTMIAFPDWKVKQSPFLAANALWVAAQFASHFPVQSLANEMFDLSLNMMMTPDPEDDDGDDDDDAVYIGSWKPIRIVAGHTLRNTIECHFDDSAEFRPRLEQVLKNMMSLVEEDKEDLLCDGMQYSVLSKSFEAAGIELLPHLNSVGTQLCMRCHKDLEEGGDLLSSFAMRALVALAEGIESFLDELDDTEDEDMPGGISVEHAIGVIEEVFSKTTEVLVAVYGSVKGYGAKSPVKGAASPSKEDVASMDIPYHPDVGNMIRAILTFLSPVLDDDDEEPSKTDVLRSKSKIHGAVTALASRFTMSLPASLDDLLQAEDELPTFVLLAKYCSRSPEFFTAQDGYISPCDALLQLALPLMDQGTGRGPKAACRMFIALFNHCGDDWSEGVLGQVMMSVLTVAALPCSEFLYAELATVVAHVVVRNLDVAISSARECGDVGQLLFALSRGLPFMTSDRAEKVSVWAGIKLINRIGLTDKFSASDRRQCGDLLIKIFAVVNDGEDADDGAEAEASNGSSSSDDSEDSDEEEEDGVEDAEENEADFLARYEEEAKKMEDGADDDDDDEELEVLFDCEDELDVYKDISAKGKFSDWFSRKGEAVKSLAKKKTMEKIENFMKKGQ